MSKDLQTNIAGGIAAAAIVAEWTANKFGVQLGITADFLNAIVVLAGCFIAYKVGKPGNTVA
jgi:hypothetical protein